MTVAEMKDKVKREKLESCERLDKDFEVAERGWFRNTRRREYLTFYQDASFRKWTGPDARKTFAQVEESKENEKIQGPRHVGRKWRWFRHEPLWTGQKPSETSTGWFFFGKSGKYEIGTAECVKDQLNKLESKSGADYYEIEAELGAEERNARSAEVVNGQRAHKLNPVQRVYITRCWGRAADGSSRCGPLAQLSRCPAVPTSWEPVGGELHLAANIKLCDKKKIALYDLLSPQDPNAKKLSVVALATALLLWADAQLDGGRSFNRWNGQMIHEDPDDGL
eukprot:g8109.t1